MPAEQIAANLAYINWTVLAGAAVGAIWAAALGRLRTDATKGYLGFIALSAAVLAALAALSDGALPAPAIGDGGAGLQATSGWDLPRVLGLWLLAAVALVFGIAVLSGRTARGLAVGGAAIGAVVLVAAALSWAATPVGSALLLIQLAILAAATGGAWAAMILGHWYLVTPKLPEAPLVRFARTLLLVVGAQVALFGLWQLAGAGPAGQAGFAALVGPWALFVWLRLIVGLVMPLVVTWAAVQTARTRSMESATGLLYIDVGLIAAGTILAAGLYFGAGILV